MDIIHLVIDIDNTILDGTTTHLKYCNLVSGKNILKEEVTQFYIYPYYDWTLEDFERVYEQYGVQMHEESIALPDAIATLARLKDEHRITFMTARPEKYRAVTEKWLRDNNIYYDQLIMTEHKMERFISEAGDILIDDSPNYALQFSQYNLPMIIIDYPYNRDVSGCMIRRAQTWIDIEREINNLVISTIN